MSFDPNSKEFKVLFKYLEGKSYLVIDPSKLMRVPLKKILAPFRLQVFETNPSDQYIEIEKIVSDKMPDIVFSPGKIQGESYEQLLNLHTMVAPDRYNSSFFIMTEDENINKRPEVRISAIDGIFLPPFTMQGIEQTVLKFLLTKAVSSKNKRSYYKAMVPYYSQKLDEAKSSLQNLVDNQIKSPEIFQSLGEIYSKNGNTEKAIECFINGLSDQSNHYGCIYLGLVESLKCDDFNTAYSFATELIANHDIAPAMIESLIKVSIANKAYEDIFTYTGIMEQQIELATFEQKQILAAGLILCAQKFNEALDKKKTDKALELGMQYAGKNLKMLKRICHVYIQSHQTEPVEKILKLVSETFDITQEVETFEFEIETFFKDDDYIFSEGIKNLKKGLKSIDIYENIIKASIKLERKKYIIEDLIYEAQKEFPQDAERLAVYFTQLKDEA